MSFEDLRFVVVNQSSGCDLLYQLSIVILLIDNRGGQGDLPIGSSDRITAKDPRLSITSTQ